MTDLTITHIRHAPARSRFSPLRYLDLYNQRRALAAMDAAQLRDLGLSYAQAQAEAARPVWDAPHHWHK